MERKPSRVTTRRTAVRDEDSGVASHGGETVQLSLDVLGASPKIMTVEKGMTAGDAIKRLGVEGPVSMYVESQQIQGSHRLMEDTRVVVTPSVKAG